MKVAWVSPLPPTPSGIGDYSADLLPEVAALAPTVAFTSEPQWRPHPPAPGLEVRPFAELPSALEADPRLIPVYHQGNNPFHTFVYDLARRDPGVLVLHDVVLHHFLVDRADRTGDWSHYESPLVEQYGEAGSELYRLRRAGLASDLDKFLFPLSGPLIRRSAVTVVHSRYAEEIARMEWPGARFQVIPHHAGRAPAAFARSPDEIRAALGIDEGAVLVGAFGYITVPKQGDVLLEGFAELLRGGARAFLVFVGSDEQRGGLEQVTRRLGIRRRVRFTGYLSRPEFYDHLNATDVVVALRYPSAAETSGTLSRALSLGRCLVVTDYASFAEVPRGAAAHVPPHGDAAAELARILRRLIDEPEVRRSFSRAALRYASTALSTGRCARLYVETARTAHAIRARGAAAPA